MASILFLLLLLLFWIFPCVIDVGFPKFLVAVTLKWQFCVLYRLFHLWLITLLAMNSNLKFILSTHFSALAIHLLWVSSVVVEHRLFVSFLVSSLFSHLMLCYWISYVFMHLFLLRWSLLHLLLSEHLRVYLRIPYFFLVYTVDLCCTFAFEVALVEVYEIYWEWFLHNAFQLFMALGVDCNLSPIHKLMKSYTSK